MKTRALLLLALIAATVSADRATKVLASHRLAGSPARSYLGDTVRLVYAENAGAFLSLGATQPRSPASRMWPGGTAAAARC